MRFVKTGKSIMNITEEEANILMEMVYGTIRRGNIPKVKSIVLNDEDDIQKVSGDGYVSPKIKIEFLINARYLKIKNQRK